MIGSPKLAAWLVLTITAAAALLAWVFPDAIRHRGQIDAAGTQVVVCAAEHPHEGRAQVLHHLAGCARTNTELRHELADELTATLLLTLTITGTYTLIRQL